MKQLAPKIKKDEENKCYYITTSQARVSFPKLVKPVSMEDNPEAKKKYSLSLLFPKKHDRQYLIDAVNDVAKMTWGKKLPNGWTKPFKDGDSLTYDGYAGMMAMSGSSSEDFPIQIIDRNKQPMDPKDLYAGCWARASITIKAYEFGKVKKGVTVYVQGLQKIADDEAFGNARDVAEDFEDEDLGEEDYGPTPSSEDGDEETVEW